MVLVRDCEFVRRHPTCPWEVALALFGTLELWPCVSGIGCHTWEARGAPNVAFQYGQLSNRAWTGTVPEDDPDMKGGPARDQIKREPPKRVALGWEDVFDWT